MTERGFAVEVVFCETCSDTAEGLPDGRVCKGLPEGWIVVSAMRYKRTRTNEITSAYEPVGVRYYCSEAHLPGALLNEEPKDQTG
jgi:hypothetical protein